MHEDNQRPSLSQTILFLHRADYLLCHVDTSALNPFIVSSAMAGVTDAIQRLTDLQRVVEQWESPTSNDIDEAMRHVGAKG